MVTSPIYRTSSLDQEVADRWISHMRVLKASREKSPYKEKTCFSAFTAIWLRSFQVDMAETRQQQQLDHCTTSNSRGTVADSDASSTYLSQNGVSTLSNMYQMSILHFLIMLLIFVLGHILYLHCQITWLFWIRKMNSKFSNANPPTS